MSFVRQIWPHLKNKDLLNPSIYGIRSISFTRWCHPAVSVILQLQIKGYNLVWIDTYRNIFHDEQGRQAPPNIHSTGLPEATTVRCFCSSQKSLHACQAYIRNSQYWGERHALYAQEVEQESNTRLSEEELKARKSAGIENWLVRPQDPDSIWDEDKYRSIILYLQYWVWTASRLLLTKLRPSPAIRRQTL